MDGRLDSEGAGLQEHFAPIMRLITYGTFRPGEENHHIVAPLGGTWHQGWIEGSTRAALTGNWKGYAGFVPGGPRLDAWMLESTALPQAWDWLDTFEGEAFRRLAIPFHLPDGRIVEGQVYTLRDGGTDSPGDA